jgi:signal transduction histidine kinase
VEAAVKDAVAEVVLIPIERELQERLGWLVRIRWLAGVGLVFGSLAGLPLLQLQVPYWPLASVGLGVLAYNLLLFLAGDRLAEVLRSQKRAAHVQIALDWAALTATVFFTGGIRSPAALVFVFHLIIGAILLSRRACYLLTTAAVILAAAFAMLRDGGGAASHDVQASAAHIAAPVEVWAGLSCLFIFTTYLATSISARLREKEAALFESQRSLERAYHGMESLYSLGQLVNSTLDLDEVLRLIARHATTLLHGRAASIRLLDRAGKTLSMAGSYGLSDAYVNKGPVDVENSVVDADALEGRVIQALDVTDDPRFQYPDEARREGLRSMLSCPMTAKNRTLGVIRVYTAEVHAFSEQEEHLLLNLANLGAVAIENARSYGDLQRLDQERVWFARTTHHQLRSPLAAVQGAIDALEFAGPLTGTQSDLVSRARRRIQDAFDTIRDLLDLAAAQRVEEADGPEPTRLADAIGRLLEGVQERCRAKGLAFVSDLNLAECGLRIAPADLERVFGNLLDNAVKYTRAGQVGLSAVYRDRWLEAVVEDTGMGIDPGDLGRVFDNFFRSTSAKESGEVGTGLGLAIVQRLVQRPGGTISVTSNPGRGTRFTVRLPAEPGASLKPPQTAEPAPAAVR